MLAIYLNTVERLVQFRHQKMLIVDEKYRNPCIVMAECAIAFPYS